MFFIYCSAEITAMLAATPHPSRANRKMFVSKRENSAAFAQLKDVHLPFQASAAIGAYNLNGITIYLQIMI
jgi:hypothetical protein